MNTATTTQGSRAAQDQVVSFAQDVLVRFKPETIESLQNGQETAGSWSMTNGRRLSLTAPQPFYTSQDGQCVSVKDFILAYCKVHETAIDTARLLIAHHRTSLALKNFRASREFTERSTVKNISCPSLRREAANGVMCERIMQAAADPQSPHHHRFGLNMAIMALDFAERRAGLIDTFHSKRADFEAHRKIMETSIQAGIAAGGDNSFQAAFEAALHAKHRQGGKPVKVVILNDVDCNLSAVEHYNSLKPSFVVDMLFQEVIDYHQPGIPGYQRCPLVHELVSDEVYGKAVKELYVETGRSIRQHLHSDVLEAARVAHELNIDFRLLTGNLVSVGEGVRSAIGFPSTQVIGSDLDNMRSGHKPIEVFGALAEDPSALLIVVDDSDGGLVRNLNTPSVLSCNSVPLPLHHTAFLVARGPDIADNISHQFHSKLQQVGLLHGLNHATKVNDQSVGYQTVNRLLDSYRRYLSSL